MDLHDLLMRIEALEAENRRLAERVSELERREQPRDYEVRYPRHPHTCACDKCLQRRYGSYS